MTENARKNSFTPRDKRRSNGPEPSPADKYPEDSPTRTRPPPRFPTTMQNNRIRNSRRFPQQQELNIQDTEAFPTLGEASKLPKNPKKAARISSTAPAMRSRSVSPSGSVAQHNIPKQEHINELAVAAQLSPEERGVIEAQVDVFRQRLIQQRTPTRARSGFQQQLLQRVTPAQERIPARPQPASHSAFQQCLREEGFEHQPWTQEQRREEDQEIEKELVQRRRPEFAQESIADLVAAQQQQQQQQIAHQQQLAASQQAQRQATVAQLHSAFFEPRPAPQGHNGPCEAPAPLSGLRFHQPTATGVKRCPRDFNSQRETLASIPGLGYSQTTASGTSSSLQERTVLREASAAIPGLSSHQPTASTAPGLNPDLAAYLANVGISSPTGPAHEGYDNPQTYAPVFDTEPETPWTQADYDTTAPPSPSMSVVCNDLRLLPDPRPLSPSQENGQRYGIELGALGSFLLGTSDRDNWLPVKWNLPDQGRLVQSQLGFRVRPRDHDGWGGWDWAMKKGWAKDSNK